MYEIICRSAHLCFNCDILLWMLTFFVISVLSFVSRVLVKEEPAVGQKRSKKESRDSRETTPVTADRPSSSDSATAASLSNNLPTNNNIKTPAASATRQETIGTRNRNTRIEMPVKAQSNTVENTDSRSTRSTSPPLESKTGSAVKDSKPKSAAAAVRNTTDTFGSTSRKAAEPKRIEHRAVEESKRVEEKNKSYPENVNDEIISVVVPNRYESVPKRDWKDSKEPKGKQKRKTKAVNKKDEKDRKLKMKESATAKSKDDEGVLSDDSCSDGSSDKSVPEVRIQQPSKETNRTRQGSLPTDCTKHVSHPAAAVETVESGKDRGKNRKNVTENAGSKPKRGEAQSPCSAGRPKTLDVPAKNQNNGQISKNQSNANSPDSVKTSEMRHPGPTSPHAIAAAVMSLALGKNMQASSKENNFDEQELNKRKAYNKSSALSTTLSDSPPPTSPTLLSGSSRSSSYSSIVSSDSSNGAEQVKPPGTKANKSRVKSTKSVPLEGGAGPSWSGAGKTIRNKNKIINTVQNG